MEKKHTWSIVMKVFGMHTLLIVILFLPALNYAQVICPCDSLEYFSKGDTFNVSKGNLKQGNWIHYKAFATSVDGSECGGGRAIFSYQITARGKYLDNNKHGQWVFYHKDSSIQRKVYFDHGKLDSTDSAYRLNGSLFCLSYWSQSEKDSVVVYHDNGQVHFTARYEFSEIRDFVIFYPGGGIKYKVLGIKESQPTSFECFDETGKMKQREFDLSTIAILEKLEAFFY